MMNYIWYKTNVYYIAFGITIYTAFIIL